MGYTHYWTQKEAFTNEQWVAIIGDFRKIYKAVLEKGVPLQVAAMDGDLLQFNGVDDQEHEDFGIERTGSGFDFDFCKTARKDYDLAVTAMLLRLKHHAPHAIEVTSDGGEEDWQPARDLVLEVFGGSFSSA